MSEPIDGKKKSIAVYTSDSFVVPLCNKVINGNEFFIDSTQKKMSAQELINSGRLLRIVSSDKRGETFLIDEYIDNDIHIPIANSDSDSNYPEQKQIISGENSGGNISLIAITSPLAPSPVGPYSQAVRAGPLLFVSGCVGIDPATNKLVSGDIAQQTARAMDNLGLILAEAGTDFSHVTKTTLMLADLKDFSLVNEIYSTYFPTSPSSSSSNKSIARAFPARSTFQVAALPLGALFEIDAIAFINDSAPSAQL
jgi:2-iminobutanoate/2-iminopropanoate deaminase